MSNAFDNGLKPKSRKMTAEKRREIQQQLSHARRGMRHYEKLVMRLEKQLEKLKTGAGGRGRADPNLPRTTTQFWLSLVGKRPKTTNQIIEAAVKKLELEDVPNDLVAKLRLRWSVAVITLVKEGKIEDKGQRHTRTFRLPSQ